MKHNVQHTIHDITTFGELAEVLSNEISKLINGKTSIEIAKTVAALARAISSNARQLIEYKKVTGKDPKSNYLDLFPQTKDKDGNGKQKMVERFISQTN